MTAAAQLRAAKASDFKAGDRVVYRDSHTRKPEEGTVTSTNDHFVFVCYGLPGSTSQATNPGDLEFVNERGDRAIEIAESEGA